MNKYTHLFAPLNINGLKIKNRIFSAPTGLMSYTSEGHLTTENIAYYERKAMGGAAVVTLGESIVHCETGLSHDRQIAMDDPNVLPSLAYTAKAITRYGAVANIELSHGGKYAGITSIGGDELGGRKAYGPSAEVTETGEQVYEMPKGMITMIAEAFGSAAALAKKAGFGMVMVHGGHGWLLNQFLSPKENKRTDEFGGSLENRVRFTIMVLEEVRKAVGPRFPIQLRMNGEDFIDGGVHLEDYKTIAKMVEPYVDLFNISCGSHDAEGLFVRTHPSIFLDHGCNVYLAAEIKKVTTKPVSCVGALNDPAQMEEIIASGKADIVELGRALLADPDLPKKAFEGREDDITPCLRCYTCFHDLTTSATVRCAVNPIIGHELDDRLGVPAPERKKKIFVAGGGPGGMQAAVTAAERGHDVTLYEASGSLGGALKFAEHVSFKQDLYAFSRHLARRVEKSNVQVKLNQPLDKATIESENPDVTIFALGAEPIVPPIPGIDSKNVVFATQAEGDPASIGEKLVILGGGLVGCETGISLAEAGKQVTIVEMANRVAQDVNQFHDLALQKRLAETVTILTGTTGKEITADGIRCEGETGEEIFLEADNIICAVGMKSRDAAVDAMRDTAREQYIIGDCVRPGQVTQAVFDGYYLARSL